MSAFALVVAWTCVALELALLAGLFARGRVKQCYLLPLLALGWLVTALVVLLCPACHTWDFWIFKELLHALLAFILALELSWRAFRPVPRAWVWARVAIVGSSLLGVSLIVAMPPGPVSVRVVPWILAALAWLYGLLSVIQWALKMPEEVLHRAILWGLPPYLILYAATWGQAGDDVTLPNIFNPVMFSLVLGVLVWAAWRREPAPPTGHVEAVRWLWPWR